MNINPKRRHLIAAGAAVVIASATAFGVATATSDDEQPLAGETYDRAVAAALAHTGGGAVTETEVGDDGAAYEVEVRLDDGTQLEVQLDADFVVIGDELDDDSGENSTDDD